MKGKYYLVGIFCLYFFLSSSLSTTVLINSKNWEDVYSCIMYAHFKNYEVAFLNSPNAQGIFNILPKDKLILMQSKSNPYVPNLEGLLKAKGYSVIEKIEFNNANLELADKIKTDNYIIIDKDYPYNAVAVAPYAYITSSWVFIADSKSIGRILPYLKKSKQVLGYGLMQREIQTSISPYLTKLIQTGNKFKDSMELAKEFKKIRNTRQVLITEGYFLEEELLSGSKGHNPVLIVGTNKLPDEFISFLEENNFDTCILIGANLGYIGEKIREESNKKIHVFLKFGQAVSGVSNKIYALSLFPLPSPTFDLTISKVEYSPQLNKLYVFFNNRGSVGIYAYSVITLKTEEGKDIASLSDNEPIFIPKGNYVVSYPLSLNVSLLSKTLYAVFFTSYGETKENLDRYITAKGKFGPPLKLEVGLFSGEENTFEVKALSLTYDTFSKKFIVKLKNPNNFKVYSSVCLLNIPVHGIEKIVCSDLVSLPRNADRDIFIEVDLDKYDIEEIKDKDLGIKILYGKSKDAIIGKKELSLIPEISSGIVGAIIANTSYFGIVVLVILIIIFLKRREPKSKFGGYKYKV